MTNRSQATHCLLELKNLVAFLQGLWGILAGLTALFPLSNVLVGLMPLGRLGDEPGGALGYLSPGLITAVAMIVTVFVILFIFGQRSDFRAVEGRRLLQRPAWLSFTAGLLALIVYFAVNFGMYPIYYEPFGVFDGDPRLLIGDLALLLSYSAFFALVTRAFMLLAMIEYSAGDVFEAAEQGPAAVVRSVVRSGDSTGSLGMRL